MEESGPKKFLRCVPGDDRSKSILLQRKSNIQTSQSRYEYTIVSHLIKLAIGETTIILAVIRDSIIKMFAIKC